MKWKRTSSRKLTDTDWRWQKVPLHARNALLPLRRRSDCDQSARRSGPLGRVHSASANKSATRYDEQRQNLTGGSPAPWKQWQWSRIRSARDIFSCVFVWNSLRRTSLGGWTLLLIRGAKVQWMRSPLIERKVCPSAKPFKVLRQRSTRVEGCGGIEGNQRYS